MSAVVAPSGPKVAGPAALELRDVCKDYGGLRAVSAVSTVARPGEVLGIAGPNGAGKTTLFDVISGLTPATSGDVLLGVFDRKRLMIATALAMGPRVLLLDEPFGGLNPDEIQRTLELVRGVAAFGVTVVCIEHVMRALVQLAQRVVVMHHGAVLFEGSAQEMLRDERVIEIYLGEKAARRDRP